MTTPPITSGSKAEEEAMAFLVYASKATALARSASEAEARGAGRPDDVTQFWWGAITDPATGETVMALEDGDPPRSGGKAPVSEPPAWYADLVATSASR